MYVPLRGCVKCTGRWSTGRSSLCLGVLDGASRVSADEIGRTASWGTRRAVLLDHCLGWGCGTRRIGLLGC